MSLSLGPNGPETDVRVCVGCLLSQLQSICLWCLGVWAAPWIGSCLRLGSWNLHIQCPAGVWSRGWFQEPCGGCSDKEDGSQRSVGRQLPRLATRMLRAEKGLCLGETGKLFNLRGVDKVDFMGLSG